MDNIINKITVRFSLWYEIVRTMDTVFIVMLLLKLFKVQPVVNISWWWITAPIWVPFTFVLTVLVICFAPDWIRSMARWFKGKSGKEDAIW